MQRRLRQKLQVGLDAAAAVRSRLRINGAFPLAFLLLCCVHQCMVF